jgi:hypothetical protein
MNSIQWPPYSLDLPTGLFHLVNLRDEGVWKASRKFGWS